MKISTNIIMSRRTRRQGIINRRRGQVPLLLVAFYFAAALCAQVISAEQAKQTEPFQPHLRRRLTSRASSDDASGSGSDSSSSSGSSGGSSSGSSASSSSSGRSTPSVTKFARTIMDVLKDRKPKGIYHDDLRNKVFDTLDVKGNGKDDDAFEAALERLEEKDSIKIGKHRVKLILSQDHTDQSKTGEEMSDDSSGTGDDNNKSGGEGGNRVADGDGDEEGDQSNDVISDDNNAEAENRIDDENGNTDGTDPLSGGAGDGDEKDSGIGTGINSNGDPGTNDNEGTGDGDGDAGVDSGTDDNEGTGEGNNDGEGAGTVDGSTESDGEEALDAADDLDGEEDLEGEVESNKALPDGSEVDVEDGGMSSNGGPCQADEECSSGACVIGMCSSPVSDGDACDSDGDCLSSACGSTSLSPGSSKICCATGSRLQDVCTGQENGAICVVTSVARQSLSDNILLNGICASGFCNKDGFCDDDNEGETEDSGSQQGTSGTDGENEEEGTEAPDGENGEEDTGTGTEPDADDEEGVTSRASEGGGSCNTGCKVGASVGSVAAVGAAAAAVAAKKRKKDDEE